MTTGAGNIDAITKIRLDCPGTVMAVWFAPWPSMIRFLSITIWPVTSGTAAPGGSSWGLMPGAIRIVSPGAASRIS